MRYYGIYLTVLLCHELITALTHPHIIDGTKSTNQSNRKDNPAKENVHKSLQPTTLYGLQCWSAAYEYVIDNRQPKKYCMNILSNIKTSKTRVGSLFNFHTNKA
jgi:hypothetical protein